jgi:hypothetical protein
MPKLIPVLALATLLAGCAIADTGAKAIDDLQSLGAAVGGHRTAQTDQAPACAHGRSCR